MKNFLHKYSTIINIGMAVICTVCLIISWVLPALPRETLKEFVGVSGPFGDTLGGTITPIIGCFTLLYVYRTYIDQTNSNKHSKSATNLDVLIKLLENHQVTILALNIPDGIKDKDIPFRLPSQLNFDFEPLQRFLIAINQKLEYYYHLAENAKSVLTEGHKYLFGTIKDLAETLEH